MLHCPQCQHSLPTPRPNRRQACTLCGWVEPPPEQPQRVDAKAQEIARERALDATPVWKYVGLVLGGLTLLVFLSSVFSQGIVSVVKRPEPSTSPASDPPSPESPPQATAVPAVSNVPVTVPTAVLPEGPSATPGAASPSPSVSPASGTPTVSPSPSGSVDVQAEASAQTEAVASSLNALESAPASVPPSASPQLQPPALPGAETP